MLHLSRRSPSLSPPPSPSQTLHSHDQTHFGQLGLASNIIDDRLDREFLINQRAQLDSSLQGHSSSDYTIAPSPNWAPLLKRRTIHLPDVLFDQYDIQEHRCLMGIFPEIERAWFTVDNRLFLWDYVDGADFASFEQLEEIISAITLTKPKPGLFVADIQHILVIATPLMVTIVGLALKSPSPPTPAELSLYLTGLSIPTDGILFTAILSHHLTGRIFLLGATDSQAGITHGNELYEFEYRSEEGWFKKRCALLNHSRGGTGGGTFSSLLPSWLSPVTAGSITMLAIDQNRHLIYALTKSGSIRMLSLGISGQDPPTEAASVVNIVREALGMCPAAGPLLDPRTFEINGLHIVSKQEGGKVALVVTTTMGVRLYFSHARRGYGYGYVGLGSSSSILDQDWNPPALWLCHVRLPPRDTPMSQQATAQLSSLSLASSYQPPRSVPEGPDEPHSSDADMAHIPSPLNLTYTHYTSPGGFFVAAHGVDSERNIILTTATDVGQHVYATSVSGAVTTGLQSTTQPQPHPQPSMSEIASPISIEGHAWAITRSRSGPDVESTIMELAGAQHEWLVLSNMGITVLASQRPVDTLAGLLDSMPGRDHDLAVFWERFGRDQTCAMCICIAVTALLSSSLNESNKPNSHSLLPTNLGWGSQAAPHAKKLLFESSGRPEIVGQGSSLSYATASSIPGVDDRKLLFSGKHEGLALYMSWLLRPIWRQKVVISRSPNDALLVSNVSEAMLTKVQRELNGLRNFMDNEAVLLTALPDARTTGRTDPAVFGLEQASIMGMRALLTQAVEALSFILLLMDYKFSDVMQACPDDMRNVLKGLAYCEFITGKQGRDCARELVKTLINKQIGQSFSVDAISETLQQRCGTFCTSDDVLLYKAIEALNRAKETQSEREKRDSAREALRLFKKGAKHISIELLQNACSQFMETAFLDGVVELCITCARVWDGGHQALAFWKDGKPKGDARAPIYELLDQCYLCIEEALLNFGADSDPAGRLTPQNAAALRDHAVQLALSSDDEFFHYHYYDWLLGQNKTIQLLESRTPFLEGYLKTVPTTLVKADLLWQHYARNSSFFEAARILANLAADEALPLALPRRIEYLSLAVSNAKSSPHLTSGNGDAFEFLTDIEEKLDVAQVQVEVLQNVVDLNEEDMDVGPMRKEDVLDALQRRLFTISELYRDVVQPLSLLDSTLLIFHVSDHRDQTLTETVWREIVERAHIGHTGIVRGPEAVAGKVAELGRKFYPSDIAFNLPMVISMVEKYAFDHPSAGRPRWVGPMLREAGVPWQAIWESMDELFTTKVPPWHVNGTLAFLAFELAGVIEEWVEEVRQLTGFSPLGVTSFPAARLDDVIERYIHALGLVNTPEGEYPAAARRLGAAKIAIRETF